MALVKTELRAMKLAYWIFAFVHGYRYEAGKLKTEETAFFEPYVKEQTLARPCQVEAIQFSKPCRTVLLFFFDKSKQDLLIFLRKEKWDTLAAFIHELQKKYHSLHLSYVDLHKLLKRCRHFPRESMFAIDSGKNVCLICFMHDPRTKSSLYPWKLTYISNPQEMAETILHLNLDQSSLYFDRQSP